MGAYVVSGGAGDAYSRRGVSLGSFIDYIWLFCKHLVDHFWTM